VTASLPLDTTIAALCATASLELAAMSGVAAACGQTLPSVLEAFRAHAELVETASSCGHLATASRGRRARYVAYCSGHPAPRRARVNSDEQVKARARQWGHAA
jgi:hypothetical protein